jgi:prepilin-type N-terminal cleavage/methylation domain-containing protein
MKQRSQQHGMTLIELMVALAIGAFLMIGAMTVFMQSRTTFRVNDSVSRLQENARFALEAIEPDIRMAHYWGLTARSYLILQRRPMSQANGLGPSTCGNNWTIDLDRAVAGTNNGYTWACADAGGTVEANSDTLIVRRASEDPEVPTNAGTISIQSTRSQLGTLFTGTALPGGYTAATSQTHRLVVNGYFIRRATATVPPMLRAWVLQRDGTLANTEVLRGVEDMQIEFGVDTDVPGTPVIPNPNRGSVDRWVNPNAAIIDPTNAGFNANAEILAVRVWLRVRADRIENGFTDTATYTYADTNVGPFNDAFRRMVVSKTIYLRNARPAS